MANFKVASSADEKSAAQLLETIRQENPSLWPHGLSLRHFNPGDLFLVQKQASDETVGFVGWQEKELNGRRTGFYSIGLLPEHRGKGLAKAAVQKLIEDRAPRVDQIRALIVDGNTPSEKLAETLGIPVLRKQASPLNLIGKLVSKTPLGRYVIPAAGGVANAAVYDQFMPRVEGEGLLDSKSRSATAALNFITGALGTRSLGQMRGSVPRGAPGYMTPTALKNFNASKANSAYLGILGVPMAKVFLGQRGAEMERAAKQDTASNSLQDKLIEATAAAGKSTADVVKNLPPWALLLGAGALTGGVGYAAHRIAKALKEKSEAPVNIRTNQGGRLKVTLPTKNPGDTETVIDVPFDQETAFSDALRNRLALDTRRRLYAETKQRVRTRIPKNIDAQITAGLP